MTDALWDRCAALVCALELGAASDVRAVAPLTGGVASDIAVVNLLGQQRICVKFALPTLRVKSRWEVPVGRNAAEYAWLKMASEVAPESGVTVLGHSPEMMGFAMEFVEGDTVTLWKAELLAGRVDPGASPRVADVMGRVHRASTAAGFDRGAFRNRDDFHAIRIEPYLSTTRANHPDLADQIAPQEDALYANETAVIHGDASPKNILFRDGNPILLDAECATVGDPAFDVAFCLNHLALKSLHMPAKAAALMGGMSEFWQAYRPHVIWEDPVLLEARVCALLPVLMLARVDGKSPVEYLQPETQEVVRATARPLIQSPPATIAALCSALRTAQRSQVA